ncbi:MAG: aminotransferase class I/II-fold pyridoxal phosphate-dependent enzyme [Lachnospiraceae bacterium]|nr:aminotransferase class I/II-fold pyridoxal phosphate-dependent enzyme [Lachnospiraceae bacterium]
MDVGRRDISLTEKLKEYAASDIYPYHMPGHKGSTATGSVFDDLHGMDITEIDGFDDLHHATGILKEAQDEAAQAFGADRTFYLVGGSTVGILTAISAAIRPGGGLLMVRSCHKSVYHAAYLRGLKLHYILQEFDWDAQILKPVTAAQVREALQMYPDVGAVLITSPTYEGLAANVREIAEAVHERNLPLIVDEAHGAHFGFASCLPQSSNAWADLVVQSLHKTTKALTQTALLHVNGDRVSAERVQKFLDIYMTSSPSYLFMASMEEAIRDLRDNGERLYGDFIRRKEEFLKKTAGLKALFVYRPTDTDGKENGRAGKYMDPCKILICSRVREFSGKNLYDELRQKYHLQMELCENNHVLAIMTPYDRQEGFDRLAAALGKIDRELLERYQLEVCSWEMTESYQKDAPDRGRGPMVKAWKDNRIRESDEKSDVDRKEGLKGMTAGLCPHLPRQTQTLTESWVEGHSVPLTECAGKISAAFVYQYPPGIPLIVPGEVWDEAMISQVQEKIAVGYEILGIAEKCGTIEVAVVD